MYRAGLSGSASADVSLESRHATASTRYVAVQIVGLGITTITAFVVSAVPGIPATLALVIAAGTAALASYLLQKLWVF
jgi:putative flippase GtrA